MGIVGRMLLFVVAGLLSACLLICIPELLGQKFGLWCTKNRPRSQDNLGNNKAKHAFLPAGALPWWGTLAAVTAVEAIVVVLVVLDVPNIPPQRPIFPVYIYRVLLTQRLSEPVYVIVCSTLMVVAFFIAGLLNALRVMQVSNSAGRGSE